MDPLCTNKLTQEKCQRIMKFCFSGGKTKIIIPLLCIRSGDKWLVKQKGDYNTPLKSSVGDDPFVPPSTGWLFNKERRDYENDQPSSQMRKWGDFEEDPSLICSMPSTSPPCCLTVTLSGAAKEAQGDCEGEYKSTGLVSMGKQVTDTLQAFCI